MKVKLSVDTHCIKNTPKDKIPYSAISKTIAQCHRELSIEEIVEVIGDGYTICSPIFRNREKKKENIIEMQLFILDFDGKDKSPIKYDDALKRANDYDLPVVISYETKSSMNFSRYRLIFLYNEPVHDIRMMNIINQLLLHIFPEADQSTSDLSKMFLPGRNVRFHCDKPFHFDTLIVAARSFCCSKISGSKSTWVNLLDSLSNKYGLIIKGTDIFTSDEINPPQFGTFAVRSIYYNMEGSTKVPKNTMGKYVYFAETANKGCHKIKSNKTAAKVQLKNNSVIENECQLMNDFINGNRLPHEEWFGLATNLISIKGGQKIFSKTLDLYSDLYGNVNLKIEQMEYAAQMDYNPCNCDNFCPYSDECPHEANIPLTLRHRHQRMKRVPGYSEQFYELDTVRQKIQDFFYDAVSCDSEVCVLKAPTGAGKSTMHLDFLKHTDHRTVNAYPNARLMIEKYNEALDAGSNAVHTPIIDDLYQYLTDEQGEYLRGLYDIGAGELPIKKLTGWSKDNPNIKNYLDMLENLPEDAHIFTTHSRLFRMSGKITENSIVFIDEDIVSSMISCSAVSVDEFNRLYNAVCDNHLKSKLDKIKENISEDSHYFRLEKTHFTLEYKARILNEFSFKGISFAQNIWGLVESDNFYYYTADNSVHFTVTNTLKRAKKVIMMSATANEDICRKMFGNSLCFCDVGQIGYKGKVIMHCDKSYSRAYLAVNDAEKIITEIVNNHSDCAYITFKECCKYIGDKYLHTHYGQAIGTNDFSGENLVVIGLNHRPFYVYELFARALGIDRTGTLSTRKAELFGFEFYMMTYADPELRNIQQYMISSDLEQAIGRARLIYHDCTVHLYGNFPARQGTLENEIKAT